MCASAKFTTNERHVSAAQGGPSTITLHITNPNRTFNLDLDIDQPRDQVVNFGQNASRGKNASKVVVKTTRDAQFQLLHLSVLREYVWAEFTRDMPEETVRFSSLCVCFTRCL